METRRWTNPSQPQTLYLATWLLYLNAGIALLLVLIGGIGPLELLISLVGVAAALGIAEEKRWGYLTGVIVAGLALVVRLRPLLADLGLVFSPNYLLYLVFPVALFALLVHPMSRDYQRIWFK